MITLYNDRRVDSDHWETTRDMVIFLGESLNMHRNIQELISYLGFPRRAAWCRALNPLLLVSMMSALWSRSNVSISSRFFEMASCSGVSPSESCKKKTNKSLRVGIKGDTSLTVT